MKLQYTSELTFQTEEVEFSDEHYSLAKELHRQYESELLSKCTPIMVGSDKKSLIFCVNLADKNENRVAYECGDNIYRVIVEKIQFK